MTTATTPTIDLSWVTFTEDEESEPCHRCTGEATHVGYFGVAAAPSSHPLCPHLRIPYCLSHAAVVLREARDPGVFTCAGGAWLKLIRMVPLR
jgi:hypothetical protein